ncbi:MAG: 2OG-Fe(II) oxygenase [Methylobacteriaceae bacterium]|nr:2OG-Fe(II) oxygenase [Methylobacteriaceae bacterium]MBV9635031.1 2OG-Fe(II) oxygenase [Methylobacteriaceae bacterium]
MNATSITLAIVLCGLAAYLVLRLQQQARYRTLSGAIETVAAGANAPTMRAFAAGAVPQFDRRLISVRDFLPEDAFTRLREEVSRLVDTERSFVPAHKKGGTIAYETLIKSAPCAVALYHSRDFQRFLSGIVGEKLVPTPLNDQSSLSVLFYERPGDHIGWHYDHDYYRGRHFTVLLAIENRGRAEGGLSAATLFARIGGQETPLPTAPNTLVFFEGAKVLHKVTPIAEGERRVVLSMTYATDTRSTIALAVARRLKDTAFFGVRALWT